MSRACPSPVSDSFIAGIIAPPVNRSNEDRSQSAYAQLAMQPMHSDSNNGFGDRLLPLMKVRNQMSAGPESSSGKVLVKCFNYIRENPLPQVYFRQSSRPKNSTPPIEIMPPKALRRDGCEKVVNCLSHGFRVECG